jgi:hypothetical protein
MLLTFPLDAGSIRAVCRFRKDVVTLNPALSITMESTKLLVIFTIDRKFISLEKEWVKKNLLFVVW